MADQDTGLAPLEDAVEVPTPDDATPVDSSPEAGGDGVGGSDDEVVEEESPYLQITDDNGNPVHTYKTLEDAQKTFREKESMIGKQAAKVHELEQRLAQLDQEQRLAQLEKSQQSATQQAQAKARQAEMDELREQLATDPGKALDLLMQQDEYNQRRLQEEVQKLSQSFEERLLRQTDDYSQHKDVVDVLMAKGLTLNDALEIAKKVTPVAKATHPPRPATPKAPTPKAPAGKSKPRGELSAGAAAMLQNMGFGSFKDDIAASLVQGDE
jgi:hypothetical protein